MAAEYILTNENPNVILCERGIRTFEPDTRFPPRYQRRTLHEGVVAFADHHRSVSHATGRWELVEAVTLLGVATGADGIMVEIHNDPVYAFSEGVQARKPNRLVPLLKQARGLATVLGRTLM